MRNLKKMLSVAAVCGVMFMAGCSSDNPVSPTPQTPPPTNSTISESVELFITDVDVAEPDKLPSNMNDLPTIAVDNNSIVYTNAGSGSCPPVLESATYENGAYTLKVKSYGDVPCTADLRVLQQVVTTADGQEIPDDAKVDLVNPISASEAVVNDDDSTDDVIEE